MVWRGHSHNIYWTLQCVEAAHCDTIIVPDNFDDFVVKGSQTKNYE